MAWMQKMFQPSNEICVKPLKSLNVKWYALNNRMKHKTNLWIQWRTGWQLLYRRPLWHSPSRDCVQWYSVPVRGEYSINKTKLWSIDAIVSLRLPVSASTQKYPKQPKRTQKHPIVPKVPQKHTKSTQQYPKAPKSKVFKRFQKFLKGFKSF